MTNKEEKELLTDYMRKDLLQGLNVVSMTELYDTAYQPRTPVIEGLLNCGLYIFSGAPKIGKSFLVLQLAYSVATGQPIWDYPVHQGSVLYLALEDNFSRLQERLSRMFGEKATSDLHLAVRSKKIQEGLVGQINAFVDLYPDTRLIIISSLTVRR